MKKYFLTPLFITCISIAYAQSTLINALPLEYNPSFAGSTGVPRLSSSTLIEKNKFHLGKITYSSGVSYDNFISKIRTGIGLSLNYSSNTLYMAFPNTSFYTGTNTFNSPKLSGGLAISPKFSFKGKYTIAPSVQALYGSNENYILSKHFGNFFTLRAGILFNSKQFYIGYTVDIIHKLYGSTKYTYIYENDPANDILIKQIYKIPFTSNLQVGFTTEKGEDSKFSYTPLLTLSINGRDKSFDNNSNTGNFNIIVNNNFKYKNLLAGTAMGVEKQNTSFEFNKFGLIGGYQNKQVKIMYAQYINWNGYLGWQMSGQLTFRFLFNKKSVKYSLPSIK